MTSAEFERAGKKLFGKRWGAPLARFLRKDPVTIWRYATGQLEIPWLVEQAILQLLKRKP